MWDISLIHMPKDFDLQLHVTLKISSFIYMLDIPFASKRCFWIMGRAASGRAPQGSDQSFQGLYPLSFPIFNHFFLNQTSHTSNLRWDKVFPIFFEIGHVLTRPI